jgi:molybdenum cofactor guanylyltransferase
MPDLTVAILAGGKSSRMGTDKAFVSVLGRPLIEHVLAQVAGLGDETLIVTNRPEAYADLGVALFSDLLPDKGALGGLYTALHSASRAHVLCIACDMPFVSRPLVEHLAGLRAEADVVVPRIRGEVEPFRAVYARACLGPVAAALQAGKMRMISFYPQVRVRYVDEAELTRFDPQLISFFNVNTPQELERARQMAEEQQ